MKKLVITFLAVSFLTLAAQAQKTPKVLTVNMEELYQGYYKAQEANEKFQSSVKNAEDEVKAMIEQGREMMKELEDLRSKISNPGTADAAKSTLETELEEKTAIVRKKEAEVNQYRQTTQRTLQQRRQSIVNLHLSEIKEVVVEVAKEKGSDLVLNSNGLSVVYFDESYDITEEVSKKLNADKPE